MIAFRLPFGALAVAVAACGGVDVTTGPSQANPLDAEESELLSALNARRQTAGVAPVTPCASLNVSASKHSDDMRDRGYLDDEAPDGTTPRSRACDAGYAPACSDSIAMGELVASGVDDGASTLGQWSNRPETDAILTSSSLVVAGIGRADNGDVPYWTLDLAGATDPSCDAP